MSYQKILVALDFTDEAYGVLEKAKAQAELYKASIDVVHVAEPSSACYDPVVGQTASSEDNLQQEIQATMEKHLLCDLIASDNIHAVMGQPVTTIVNLVEELNCDLLVFGTHGRHGWRKILGSTASALVQSAPCDMLMVKIGEDENASA